MATFAPSVDWSGVRVVVTGGAGFLGVKVQDALRARGVSGDRVFVPRKKDFDLTEKDDVVRLYRTAFGEKIDVVIHLAPRSGIGANRANPGRYFYANMAMALHLIEQARLMDWWSVGAVLSGWDDLCLSEVHSSAVP